MPAGRTQSGFTLIELAVVIGIIGLLLGAILSPLSTQIAVRKNREAERALQSTSEALLGYVVSQGRLPCPDTDGDGLEDAPCNDDAGDNFVTGRVPWVTLDTDPLDPWGRIIYYGVSDEFTYAVQTGQPGAANQLDIGDLGLVFPPGEGYGNVVTPDLATKAPTAITLTAPVVLISTGANGAGGTRLDGTVLAAPAAGTDEAENVNGDPIAIRRTHTPNAGACDDATAGSTPCEFDDIVTWISGPRLMGLMVQAGQLP